jgi:UDP-N-acetylmuramate dehydrogenase
MKNVSLKKYNTFQLDVIAPEFVDVNTEQDIFFSLSLGQAPYFILGGGSNVLLKNPVEKTVLKNNIKGINVIDEDENMLLVEVGAGENWHTFVLWTLSHGLFGLENLSLIPGSVGAAPIQNIGAYGVEQESVFHSLKAINLDDGQTYYYYKDDCQFGYRNSVFKNKLKDKVIITRVRYLLHKSGTLNTTYGAIKDELSKLNISEAELTPKNVSDAVIAIRQSKLPDPNLHPNAGSFFKNPIVSVAQHDKLKAKFPDLVSYIVNNEEYKLAAGWLIEHCGFKGKDINGVGSYKNQALVIVKNSQSATGLDIWNYALSIIEEVKSIYGVDIEAEVNVI